MTRIGILSDSHGRAEITGKAIRALLAARAELLIHLGDVGSPQVLEQLIADVPACIVFGNCDDDEASLTRYAKLLHIQVDHPMGTFEVDGRRIAFTHGHIPTLMSQALANGVDYLLHGHTHEVRDERIGRTRVINPGALHRAARYTAAVLDPGRDLLEIIELSRMV